MNKEKSNNMVYALVMAKIKERAMDKKRNIKEEPLVSIIDDHNYSKLRNKCWGIVNE